MDSLYTSYDYIAKRRKARQQKKQQKILMLTKITTPITFFKMFQTMEGGSTMEIGQRRSQRA